ncbi:MAG: hypothetical protein WCX46_02485 [Candidatus Paceibacterota bacterium]
MNNKKLIRIAESFLFLPMLTLSMPFGGIPKADYTVSTPQAILSQQLNTAGSLFAFNQVDNEKVKIDETLKKQAFAIDTYFREHNMPLEGMGMKMAEEALKNGLDYRLLPATSARESTGGRHSCKRVENNPFGWASCKVGFDSLEKAIEIVAKNFGGNNPNTAKYYANKTTDEKILSYNPPHIVKNYLKEVKWIMNEIGSEDINTVELASL